jgi:hypothetical protein
MSVGTILKKIVKGVAWPFVHATETIEILGTALNDEPKVKTAIVGLVKQIDVVTADSALAIGVGGLNVAEDVADLAAAQTLFAYVKNTFIPAIEAAYKDVKADIPAAPAAATVAPGSPTPVVSSPGLHNVVPA